MYDQQQQSYTKQQLRQLEVTFEIEEMLPVFFKFLTLGGLFRTLRKIFTKYTQKCYDQSGQKTEFLRALANWIEETTQTAATEAYQYVITSRLQSDTVERCFSQYRQTSGIRFLDNLREVLNFERIFRCRSLIKENTNFWVEDITSENAEYVTVIEDIFGTRTQEIVESVLDENSAEVATTYVVKKLIKRSQYESCKIILEAGDFDIANDA